MAKRLPFKRHIPNAITMLSLILGCVSVMAAWEGRAAAAAVGVVICVFMDFLDGFAARMLRCHTEISKQLDSLSDMVVSVLPRQPSPPHCCAGGSRLPHGRWTVR